MENEKIGGLGMTAKRYFKRMWEEEFYIFDSETISEKEFDEKVEYEDYQAFADSMLGDEVVKLLNELSEENEQLKLQLQNTSDQRDEFHRGARENANRVGKLKKEIEQLKAQLLYDGDDVCGICKHEYLVPSGDYFIGKCKKGHKECSKEDIKYCEDFEKELEE